MIRRLILATMPALLTLSFVLAPNTTLAANQFAGNAAQLIAAINTANQTAAADTIILTASINLTNGPSSAACAQLEVALPVITSTITIEGQGFAIIRTASSPDFHIFCAASGANLTLANLTVSSGHSAEDGAGILIRKGAVVTILHSRFTDNWVGNGWGGALENAGTTTIINSTFSDNFARFGGAIANYGTMTIESSTFLNNSAYPSGGSIFNTVVGTQAGVITISHSTFMDNHITSGSGGAIDNLSTLTITSSAFINNDAPSDGGAINNRNTGQATVSNTTFSANSAGHYGGAVYHATSQPINLVNDTFSNNQALSGAALYSKVGSTISATNTIAASSTASNCFGTLTGLRNLADDPTCAAFGFSPSINLAALADNGGSTQTLALNAGSAALDAADYISCVAPPINAVDQRGVLRGMDANGTPDNPQPGDCDIGAFESGGFIRTLQFATSASDLLLTPQTLTIPLTLDLPLPTGYSPVTAYVWVSGGTAIAGTDYTPFGLKTIQLFPGETSASVTLQLLNSQPRINPTIILSIADQNGPGFNGPVTLGAQTTFTVNLTSLLNSAPIQNRFTIDTPTLTWNRIAGALGYEIQVTADSAFAEPYAFSDKNIPPGTLFARTTSLDTGTYYWRVRALLPGGKVSAWSVVQSFVVAI